MIRNSLCALVAVFAGATAQAQTSSRAASIRDGQVWVRPAWIDGDFQFASDFDIVKGPPVQSEDAAFLEPLVNCEMTRQSAARKSGGKTLKFYCELHDTHFAGRTIKVKYKFDDGEISGELLGSRLLWALGFGADQMFMIEDLDCYGCTKDPFRDPRVDPTTRKFPRRFQRVATERRFPGTEIRVKKRGHKTKEGWGFDELMRLLPSEPKAKEQALIYRDALRLLSVFLRHADNKPENQSLICEGEPTPQGGCNGPTRLIVHDLGATFGFGMRSDGHVSKAIFSHWENSEVWNDPENCVGRLGDNAYGEMENPQIAREAQEFLSNLLKGFSGGAEGRRRVENLFRLAHAEERGATIQQWTDLFLKKVGELSGDEFPVCRQIRNSPRR